MTDGVLNSVRSLARPPGVDTGSPSATSSTRWASSFLSVMNRR